MCFFSYESIPQEHIKRQLTNQETLNVTFALVNQMMSPTSLKVRKYQFKRFCFHETLLTVVTNNY